MTAIIILTLLIVILILLLTMGDKVPDPILGLMSVSTAILTMADGIVVGIYIAKNIGLL